MDFAAFISSSVVAGLIGALVAVRNSERKIQVENVTAERAKWRTVMRTLAADLTVAAQINDQQKVALLCGQLELNLNPFDREDQALVVTAKRLSDSDKVTDHLKEFGVRMALLLKHDWDRAKREAQPWFYRGNEPRRVPYCEYLCGMSVAPSSAPLSRKRGALVWYFMMLSFSAGIIFFLATGLVDPFQKWVKIFNDPAIEKSIGAWVQFAAWSVFCGSMWSAAYLWFKGSEKKLLENWFSK